MHSSWALFKAFSWHIFSKFVNFWCVFYFRCIKRADWQSQSQNERTFWLFPPPFWASFVPGLPNERRISPLLIWEGCCEYGTWNCSQSLSTWLPVVCWEWISWLSQHWLMLLHLMSPRFVWPNWCSMDYKRPSCMPRGQYSWPNQSVPIYAQWNVSQGYVSMWKRRPITWFWKFLTFSHMNSVFFQTNWVFRLKLNQLGW